MNRFSTESEFRGVAVGRGKRKTVENLITGIGFLQTLDTCCRQWLPDDCSFWMSCVLSRQTTDQRGAPLATLSAWNPTRRDGILGEEI